MKSDTNPARRGRRLAYGAGLLAAGTLVGGVLAGTVSASAATTASASASTAGSTTATAQQAPRGHGGATPVRSDEKTVSTTVDATLKAAALKAVPGGTVYRIETDAGDGAYEAHMTKADGALVTVKFDKNLSVTKVEQGMGQGDPSRGGPAGAMPGGPGAPGSA